MKIVKIGWIAMIALGGLGSFCGMGGEYGYVAYLN